MSNAIGSLFVELGINIAAFTDGCDKATYKSKQAAKEIGNAFSGFGREITGILGGVAGEVGGMFGEILSGTGQAISKMATQMGSISGIGGAATVGVSALGAATVATTAAIVTMAVKSAEASATLYRLSESTGVSFQSLQRFGAAAKVVGMDNEALALGLERMQKNAVTAAQSVNYGATAFGRMGINVRDSTGNLKNSSDLVSELSARFSAMPEGVERTARSMEIFGRAGASLMPFLLLGPDRIKTLGDYAARVGAVLTDEAGRGAEDFAQSLEKLELISTGAQNRLAQGVVPALEALTTAYADASHGGEMFVKAGNAVGEMLKALATEISEDKAFFTELGDALVKLNLIANLPFYAASEGPKAALAEFKKDWNELSAAQNQAKAESDAFIKSLNQKPDLFASLVKDFSPKPQTGGDIAPTQPKAKLPPAPEKDVIGEFLTKTAQAVAEQLKLADAIGQSDAAMILAKGEAAADVAISEKRVELEDRLKALRTEKRDLIAVGDVTRAAQLKTNIDSLVIQLGNLTGASRKLTAEFISKDVLASLTAMDAASRKTTASLSEQLAAELKLSTIRTTNGTENAAKLIEEADSKTKELSTSLATATEEYQRLSSVKSTLPAVLEAAKAKVNDLTASLATAKAASESTAILTAMDKLNGSIAKTIAMTVEQVSTQRELNAARLSGAGALANAELDVKLKEQNVLLEQAKADYAALAAQPGISADVLDAARSKVLQLSKAIAQLKQDYSDLAKTNPEYWQQLQEQAAKAQIQFGTLTQAIQGFGTVLANQGANSQLKLFDTLTKSADGFEDSLSKFIVTGQGAFVQTLKAMEEGLIKLGIQFSLLEGKKFLQGIFGGGGQQGGGLAGGLSAMAAPITGIIKSVTSLFGGGVGNNQGGTLPLAPVSTVASSVTGGLSAGAKTAESAAETSATTIQTAAITAQTAAIAAQTGAIAARTAAKAADATSSIGLEAGMTGVAETARQAFIGQAAAEAAAEAAIGGPAAAIAAAAATEAGLQSVTALATGGDTAPGKMYLIGEKGPELFSPGTGHVFNNDQLNDMASQTPGANYLASERSAASQPTGAGASAPRGEAAATDTTAPPAGHNVTVNHNISMMDATGFSDLLEKHSRVVAQHVDKALRHSNQRIGQ